MPTQPKNNMIYHRQGTPYECLQKGVGTGLFEERKRGLPPTSLQLIKYVSPKQEANFAAREIYTQQNLIDLFASKANSNKVKKLLQACLKTKSGELDQRAYNSVVLFLYFAGVDPLPGCIPE
jgi:hypothetical protein